MLSIVISAAFAVASVVNAVPSLPELDTPDTSSSFMEWHLSSAKGVPGDYIKVDVKVYNCEESAS